MNILRTIRPIAFWPPVLLFLAACVYNFVNPGGFTTMIGAANDWLIGNMAWAFSLGVLAMLGIVVWLMTSKFNRFARHHVTQRSAQHHRATAVDVGGELGLGQHQATARATQ